MYGLLIGLLRLNWLLLIYWQKSRELMNDQNYQTFPYPLSGPLEMTRT